MKLGLRAGGLGLRWLRHIEYLDVGGDGLNLTIPVLDVSSVSYQFPFRSPSPKLICLLSRIAWFEILLKLGIRDNEVYRFIQRLRYLTALSRFLPAEARQWRLESCTCKGRMDSRGHSYIKKTRNQEMGKEEKEKKRFFPRESGKSGQDVV